MTRPAFQFYPADWRANIKLRRCSEAARGVWIDIMCTLHDSDEYGVLRWPLADIVQAAGVKLKLVRELVDKGVLKGADDGCQPYIFTPRHAGQAGAPVTLIEASAGPCWYCSRMVRDEYIRSRRGSATRFDAENQPPKPAPITSPKPPIGDGKGDGPSSSSSSSSSKEIKTLMSGRPDDAADGALPADDPALQAKGILVYLNQRAGKNFQPVPANLTLVLARLKEGATAVQLRAMIDAKVLEWKNDTAMRKYLRPATLFNATKCSQYLGDLPGDGRSSQQSPNDWWTAAGFGSQWEAENSGCFQHNAKCFRGGSKFMGAVQ